MKRLATVFLLLFSLLSTTLFPANAAPDYSNTDLPLIKSASLEVIVNSTTSVTFRLNLNITQKVNKVKTVAYRLYVPPKNPLEPPCDLAGSGYINAGGAPKSINTLGDMVVETTYTNLRLCKGIYGLGEKDGGGASITLTDEADHFVLYATLYGSAQNVKGSNVWTVESAPKPNCPNWTRGNDYWGYEVCDESFNLKSAVIKNFYDLTSEVIVAQAKAAAELKAKQEAEAKAAAELKAKQEAAAKAAVDAKAAADFASAAAIAAAIELGLSIEKSNKTEIQAKLEDSTSRLLQAQTKLVTATTEEARRIYASAVESWNSAIRAYQSKLNEIELAIKNLEEAKVAKAAADKAAAELKAKQEAEAKAAAELKAKQEAEAKAAADKAALAKAQSELVAANAALADAQKVNRELQTQLNSVEAQFKILSDSVSLIQSQVSQLNSKLAAALAGQNALTAKLKKICSAKPKPKGC